MVRSLSFRTHMSAQARPAAPPEAEVNAEALALRSALVEAVARTCPRSLGDQADDIVQVAWLRIEELRRRSEGREELSSFYLRRTAYSAVIDELRRRRRRAEVALPTPDAEGGGHHEIPGAAPTPEQHSAGREIGEAIRVCLGALVRPRRLAVALQLQGHSVPEVGSLLGWSVKKAENLVYRGLADLRACLAAKGLKPTPLQP